jgi:hypothetical protein
MRSRIRSSSKLGKNGTETSRSTLPALPEDLRSSAVLLAGVESVTGAARLAIAAVTDMLSGAITPKETSVIVSGASLVLKGCALHLRYGKASTLQFGLPEQD